MKTNDSHLTLQACLDREKRIALELDKLKQDCLALAKRLDTRTTDEMYSPLPTEHPATRLRYHAYRLGLAREALL